MNVKEVGASKEAISFVSSLNQRLYHPTRLVLRYSGFILLVYVIYLNVGFLGLKINTMLWMAVYLSYLLLLELIRWKGRDSYDRKIFRVIRIVANTVLITWLVVISPEFRHTLSFYYLIPLTASTVYFIDSKAAAIHAYITTVISLYLGGIVFAKSPGLSYPQFLLITCTIVLLGIMLRKLYFLAIQDPINLAELGNKLHYIKNIEELIYQIADACVKISAAEKIIVIIVDPDTGRYISHINRGFDLVEGKTFEDVATHCKIIETGQGFETPDLLLETFRNGSVYKEFFIDVPRAVLAEPVYSKDNKVIGVISVSSSTPNYFNRIAKNMIRQLSYIVSSAVENCIVYRKVQLGQVCDQEQNEKLLQAIDDDEVISLLIDESLNCVAVAEGCTFHQYNPYTENLEPIAYENRLEKRGILDIETDHDQRCEMSYGIGIAGKSIEIREPIRISRITEHPWFVSAKNGNGFRNLLVTPLIDPATRKPLGTLSLCSSVDNAFTVDDEIMISRLACQSARQLSNFREFKDWRSHGGKIKHIFDEMRKLNIEMAKDELCNEITYLATKLLGFDLARLRLLDSQTNELETVSIAGVTKEIRKNLTGERMPFSVLGQFMSPKYRAGASFLIPHDDLSWRKVADKYFYIDPKLSNRQSGWKAYDAFITPLVNHNGNIIGVLTLDLPHSGKPTSQTIEKVDIFARATTWILERADARRGLMEKQQRTMAFIKSIRDVAIGTTDINGLGEVIVQIGANLLSAEGCTLHLVREDFIVLTHSNYLDGTKYIGSKKPIKLEPRCGLTSFVAATGEPVLHNKRSFVNDAYWANEKSHIPYLQSKKCESLIKVPIVNDEKRVLGVITLENKKRFSSIVDFDQEDLERLATLASEAAMAIDIVYRYEKLLRWEHRSLKDDLHELVNWYHSGVFLFIEELAELLEQEKYEEVRRQFPVLQKRALTAVDEIKTLHTAVTYKYLEEENFINALNQLINAWAGRYNHLFDNDNQINIIVDCDTGIDLPVPLRSILLRIASNAISNSLKHSGIVKDPSIQIKISVVRIGNQVTMKVLDTGNGMKEQKWGFGLTRINQLVNILTTHENIRTSWNLQSSEGQGTTIEVTSHI